MGGVAHTALARLRDGLAKQIMDGRRRDEKVVVRPHQQSGILMTNDAQIRRGRGDFP